MDSDLKHHLTRLSNECKDAVKAIQGGEYGPPTFEDLQLCGEIHSIIERIDTVLDS